MREKYRPNVWEMDKCLPFSLADSQFSDQISFFILGFQGISVQVISDTFM